MSQTEALPEYSRFADVPPAYDIGEAKAEFEALSFEDKAKLAHGLAVAVGTEKALPHLRQAANEAAVAVRNIDNMFVGLKAKLISLGQDTTQFLDGFEKIKTEFRVVVKDSHSLAVKIAQYGESFDEVVIKFCADKNFTVEKRVEKIKRFMKEGDSFKVEADGMKGRFDNLKDTFATFVGSFSTWAKGREEADQKRIKELYHEIEELQKSIEKIDAAILGVGIALAATLPITGILALIFFPVAPIIMGVGCAIAGLELSSLIGLLAAKSSLVNEKRGKEHEIENLQNEISKIKAARTQLEKQGQQDLVTFTTSVGALSQVWDHVMNDADKIHGWLKDGADDAAAPEYMKISLEKGVAVYKNMAHYLEAYANGVITLENNPGA